MRRLRLKNLVSATNSYEILGWLTALDYPTATNVLIWHQIHGDRYFMMLKKWGLFNSMDDFMAKAKEIGSRVKVFPKNFKLKAALSELNDLAGHMMADPNFDLEYECEQLANGGNPKLNTRNKLFTTGINEIMGNKTILLQHKKTFENYVKDGDWLTTGSSSIGSVYWEKDDKSGHFKARKNMLLDIYSPEELWTIISKWDATIVNKPIIKNELGKMRLAVASNLESYIYEAYFMSLMGHVYTKWKYVTLDEKEQAYLRRTSHMQKALGQGGYALPWDFKTFDHQPTTLEIETIISAIFERMPKSDELSSVVSKILKSYRQASLVSSNQAWKVKGGLQSGQRLTSLVGNVWNAAITSTVIALANKYVDIDIRAIGVRGDDTYIIVGTAVQAYYLRICYAALYAVGNDAKFSIRQFSCEFLRSEISAKLVTAWPNRAIPAITQRKPWSDNPWDPVREVITVVDNIRNVERRALVKLPKLHLAVRQQWSKFTKQSYHYLDLPHRLGGLGIYPFKGWVPDRPLPSASRNNVRLSTTLNGTMPEYLEGIVSREDFVTGSLNSKISAGDVSKVSVKLTERYLNEVRYQRTQWTFETYVPEHSRRLVHLTSALIPKTPEWSFPRTRNHVSLESTTPGFPRFDKFLSVFGYIRDKVKYTLGQLCRIHYKPVALHLKTLEAQGFHRTDAITIILGGYPTEQNIYTNPRLTTIISSIMRIHGIYVKGRDRIAKAIYNNTQTVASILSSNIITSFYAF